MTRKWMCVMALLVLLGFFAKAWSGDGFGGIAGNSPEDDPTGIALWGRVVCPFGNETGFGLMFCFVDGNTSVLPEGMILGAPWTR